jgi:hypothetical protein
MSEAELNEAIEKNPNGAKFRSRSARCGDLKGVAKNFSRITSGFSEDK